MRDRTEKLRLDVEEARARLLAAEHELAAHNKARIDAETFTIDCTYNDRALELTRDRVGNVKLNMVGVPVHPVWMEPEDANLLIGWLVKHILTNGQASS